MTTTSLMTAVAALAAVLLMVLLAAKLARLTRFARPSGASSRLQIEGSLAIDPRRRLVLVRCDGRTVLLLTGTHDMVIGWLP